MENLNELKPVGKLSPFAHFCCTIGNLPTSYMISLTYEEQLLWLCNYLEKTVIPAVNTNAEAVAELQSLYNQLKEYVDNYFNNLDIQEEINNKLNEMAESGELADIISQYLNLACLLVYDTKTDLKNAQNLTNGSIAMTLGEITYNDGHINYYKIRTITSSDIVDDNNILRLSASDTLIAERIDMFTKLNVVNELPENKENNTEYEITKYEEINTMTELPDSEYENVYNAKQEQVENEPNNIIKVGTFNCENENTPYRLGIRGIEKYNTLRKIFDKLGTTILGLNEIHDGKLYKASDLLLTNFYKYFNMIITWEDIKSLLNYGEGIISSIEPISNEGSTYTAYNAPEHQGYTKSVFNYNNKTISFYETHFCYNDNTTLLEQIEELYTIVSQDANNYKIIAGDFNSDMETQQNRFSQFLNNGFHLVNGGQFPTFTSGKAIDEIMITNNIEILEAGTLTYEEISNISDHLPLWAKLKLN